MSALPALFGAPAPCLSRGGHKRTSERAQRWGDAMERRQTRDAARRSFQRAALASRRESASGLVVAAYLSVRKDGRLVQLHLPGVAPAEMPTRGKVEGFSDDSRRRLMEMLHSIRRDAKLPVMVTLTFPAEIVLTPREAKACLLAWAKRMKRLLGSKWCYVWRLEAHPELSAKLGRVHPHLHLLTWGAFYDLAQVSASWNEVVWEVLKVDKGLHDVKAKHVAAGTNCERLRAWGGVLYCGKNYIAKAEEFPIGEDCGRVWGWWNRNALPLSEETKIPLSRSEAMIVRARVEEWMRAKRIKSDYLVCTFFGDDPTGFVARLREPFPAAGARPTHRDVVKEAA